MISTVRYKSNVRLTKFYCEFDYVRLPNPIVRLDSPGNTYQLLKNNFYQAVAFSRFGKLHEAESSFRRFQDFHVQFFEIRVFFSIFSFHCELKSIYLDRERTDKLCDKFVSLLSRCPNFPLNDVIYI